MTDKNDAQSPIEDDRIGRMPDRIREAMGSRSARAFSQQADITEGTLRNILNGGTPRLDSILRIADAADVNIGWLATGEGPKMKGELPTAISFKQVEELDKRALLDACIMLREEEDESGSRLTGRQLAQAIELLYAYASDNDASLSEELVSSMVKVIAKSDDVYKDYEPSRKVYGETRHYKNDDI